MTWKKRPDWIVRSSFLGRDIWTNRDMILSLSFLERKLEFYGLSREVTSICGSYNLRDVRGKPGTLSTHAYGISIDLNCEQLPFPTQQRGWSCHFVKAWEDAGFAWGYYFDDPMHFSIVKPIDYVRATSEVGPCIWLTEFGRKK